MEWCSLRERTKSMSSACAKPTTEKSNNMSKQKIQPTKPITDNPTWSNQEIALAQAARDVIPTIFSKTRATSLLMPRGRPKADVTKVRVGIRLSPEVLNHFKASGDGWQTRIDSALRQYISEHPSSH